MSTALESFFQLALLLFWEPIILPLLGMIVVGTLTDVFADVVLNWLRRPRTDRRL